MPVLKNFLRLKMKFQTFVHFIIFYLKYISYLDLFLLFYFYFLQINLEIILDTVRDNKIPKTPTPLFDGFYFVYWAHLTPGLLNPLETSPLTLTWNHLQLNLNL